MKINAKFALFILRHNLPFRWVAARCWHRHVASLPDNGEA